MSLSFLVDTGRKEVFTISFVASGKVGNMQVQHIQEFLASFSLALERFRV